MNEVSLLILSYVSSVFILVKLQSKCLSDSFVFSYLSQLM